MEAPGLCSDQSSVISLALLIGYSVLAPCFLALTHFRAGRYRNSVFKKAIGGTALHWACCRCFTLPGPGRWDGDGCNTQAVQRPAVLVAPSLFSQPFAGSENERGTPPGAVVARVAQVHGGVVAVAPGTAAGLLCWAPVYLVWLEAASTGSCAQQAGYRVEMGLLGRIHDCRQWCGAVPHHAARLHFLHVCLVH